MLLTVIYYVAGAMQRNDGQQRNTTCRHKSIWGRHGRDWQTDWPTRCNVQCCIQEEGPYDNLDLDLDLVSARVHLDTLGHTPIPFLSVQAHCTCIFQLSPGLRRFPWLCLLCLLLADIVLFWILEGTSVYSAWWSICSTWPIQCSLLSLCSVSFIG